MIHYKECGGNNSKVQNSIGQDVTEYLDVRLSTNSINCKDDEVKINYNKMMLENHNNNDTEENYQKLSAESTVTLLIIVW